MSPCYLKLPSTSKASAQSGVDLTIILLRTAGRSVSDNNATQPSWGLGWAWQKVALLLLSRQTLPFTVPKWRRKAEQTARKVWTLRVVGGEHRLASHKLLAINVDTHIAKLSPSSNSNSVGGWVSINFNFNTNPSIHPPTGKVKMAQRDTYGHWVWHFSAHIKNLSVTFLKHT